MKPMVNLQIDKLIEYCSNNKLPKEDLLLKLRLLNRNSNSNVHNIFKYRKFNEDFTDRVTVYDDNKIRFSYDDFLIKLFKYLNISIKPNNLSNEEIENLLLERLSVLKNRRSTSELFEEFPIIKKDYFEGLNFLDNVKNMKNDSLEEKARQSVQEKYYYQCALHPNLSKYLERQKDLYTRFVFRRDKYKEAIESSDLNDFFNEYFDMDKVMMYIINNYINICNYIDDKDLIGEYLKLIYEYLNSDYDKSVEIIIDDKYKINLEVIKERLNNVIKKINPVVSTVNWVLVPNGKKIKSLNSSTPKKINLSFKELENLKRQGHRKEEFYDNSNYIAKAIGTLKNDGYIAYIYPNGEVLLDTLYDENNPKSATGNAIYNIKAYDFELISGLDKTKLRSDFRATKIVHSKNWEKKASEIINKENSFGDREAALQLVKKLKKEK